MAVFEEPVDSLRSRCVRRGLPAVAVAILINATMLGALTSMNQLVVPQDATPPSATVLLIPQVEPPPEPEPPEPESEPPPQVKQVALEVPAPEPPPPDLLQLDLNLSMPTMSPVRVAVQRAPQQPSPVVTQPAAAPASEPARPAPRRSAKPQRVAGVPRQLAGQPPSYPRREQRRGTEGTVMAEILLDKQGHVKEVQFTSGSRAFRREVEQVIHDYRFEPVVIDGQPVEAWFVMPFRFVLEGR